MIGNLCVKLTGKEAGRYCVIVDNSKENIITIDGNLKRRNCNISHLEITNKKLEIKKGDSTEKVREAMKKAGIKVTIKKDKPKKNERPRKKSTKPKSRSK